MFGAALPTFNIGGKNEIGTHFGGCMSLLIIVLTFLYSTLKLQEMIERKKPSIITNVDENAFIDGEEYNTREENFMIAVGARNYISGQKDDARFVKWVAMLTKGSESGPVLENHELHPCSVEELEKFDETATIAKDSIEQYKRDGGLFCLDWKAANLTLHGSWRDTLAFSAIDLIMLPCITSYTLANGQQAEVRNDCVADKQEVMDYLGPLQATIFYNDVKFIQNKYGNERLENFSTLKQIAVDPNIANWIGVDVDTHSLADETQFLQLGNADEVEYKKLSIYEEA